MSTNENKYGFIGCGNMGGILALGCAEVMGSHTLLCDRSAEKTAAIAEKTGARTADLSEIAATCRYIFLGVKPQVLPQLAEDLRPLLEKREERAVIISMAAGVEIFTLERLLGDLPVIRIMPNTTAKVGKAVIPYCQNELVTEEDVDALKEALPVGRLDAISEGQMDAASALSGCGPAFVYMFIEALADGGVKCGLPRDKAIDYAAQTVLGSAEMVRMTDAHTSQLKDAVCSPGGSTIAGVHALENAAFRGAVMDAVTAAFRRTKELGENK